MERNDDYRQARAALLKRFGHSTNPMVTEKVGRACLMLPASPQELEGATELIDRAIAAKGSTDDSLHPFFLFAKGLAEYRYDRFDSAIALMHSEAAAVLGPAPQLLQAMAEHRQGKVTEARHTLAEAIASFDWRRVDADSRDIWFMHIMRREAEAMILPQLPAFLSGQYQPRDNDERLALLGVCKFKDLRAATAGLYADAFAADPSLAQDLNAGHRYHAACAAAVAGCGGGADGPTLTQPERARWRKQALQWLRLDLAARTNQIESADNANRDRLLKTLAHWRDDPDLAGLRDPAALDQRPSDERQECSALWRQFDALMTRAPAP